MDFNKNVTATRSQVNTKKVKAYRFDIFKGFTDDQGKIQRVCSVGHSTLFEGSTTYCVYLKTLLKDQFFLLPEQQSGHPYDYVILTREPGTVPGKKYFWNRVGTAKVLSDQNAGIMKLEFDLFSSVELYLSFHEATLKKQDIQSNPAA